MRVVSDNSEKDVARNRILQDLSWVLRDLTANLMRVTRGAGKPHEIGRQVAGILRAYEAHREAVGHYPAPEAVAAMLDVDPEGWADRLEGRHAEERHAETLMIKGALQVVASRLLGQRTQESAGGNELYTGLNQLTRLREEERKAWLAQERARQPVRRKSAKRSAAKAKPTKPKAPIDW